MDGWIGWMDRGWNNDVFSFSCFLHVYFNVLSVLSVPTSRNTDVLPRFPTINYQILTHMGSNNHWYLRTNLLFQTHANSQNCARRVLFLFLASESRYSARHSTYRIYIQCGWGRHLCATSPSPTARARELYRLPSWPWKKKRLGFIIFMRGFLMFIQFL